MAIVGVGARAWRVPNQVRAPLLRRGSARRLWPRPVRHTASFSRNPSGAKADQWPRCAGGVALGERRAEGVAQCDEGARLVTETNRAASSAAAYLLHDVDVDNEEDEGEDGDRDVGQILHPRLQNRQILSSIDAF